MLASWFFGAGWNRLRAYRPIRSRDCQRFCSHADLDDRPLLDLLDPRLHARVVLLPVQDLADLLAHPLEGLAVEGLLRLQPEDVVPELRAIGRRHLARAQGQDLGLDLLRPLALVQGPEVAAVLGAGVAGVLLGQLAEV